VPRYRGSTARPVGVNDATQAQKSGGPGLGCSRAPEIERVLREALGVNGVGVLQSHNIDRPRFQGSGDSRAGSTNSATKRLFGSL
jgi:hypothetical protein